MSVCGEQLSWAGRADTWIAREATRSPAPESASAPLRRRSCPAFSSSSVAAGGGVSGSLPGSVRRAERRLRLRHASGQPCSSRDRAEGPPEDHELRRGRLRPGAVAAAIDLIISEVMWTSEIAPVTICCLVATLSNFADAGRPGSSPSGSLGAASLANLLHSRALLGLMEKRCRRRPLASFRSRAGRVSGRGRVVCGESRSMTAALEAGQGRALSTRGKAFLPILGQGQEPPTPNAVRLFPAGVQSRPQAERQRPGRKRRVDRGAGDGPSTVGRSGRRGSATRGTRASAGTLLPGGHDRSLRARGQTRIRLRNVARASDRAHVGGHSLRRRACVSRHRRTILAPGPPRTARSVVGRAVEP